MIAPIAAGPAPSRNARTDAFWRMRSKRSAPSRMNENEGANATAAASSASADPRRGVAHDGDRVDDRPRRDLSEGDGVQELPARHPVVVVDGIGLHERDDHEAAAVRERADLERDPDEGAEPAGARRAGEQDRPGVRGQARASPPPPELEDAAGEQQRDEPRAEGGRRGGADEDVGRPAQAIVPRVPRPACGQQVPAGLQRHRRDGRAGPGPGAADPGRRCVGEEHRREGEDHDESRNDESEPADQRAARPRARATRCRSRAGWSPARAAGSWSRSRPRTPRARATPAASRSGRGAARCGRAARRTRCTRCASTRVRHRGA